MAPSQAGSPGSWHGPEMVQRGAVLGETLRYLVHDPSLLTSPKRRRRRRWLGRHAPSLKGTMIVPLEVLAVSIICIFLINDSGKCVGHSRIARSNLEIRGVEAM